MKKCFLKAFLLCSLLLMTKSIIAQSDIFFADPTIFYHDNTYYMYGTGISGNNEGIPMLKSKDMKNWEIPADALNGYALKKGESTFGTEGFWAPHIFEYNDMFYMFYSANEYNAVAQSNSPLGLFTQQNVTRLVDDTKQIDSFVFFDDDGKIYYYHVRFTGGNELWVAELKKDFSGIYDNTLTRCINITQSWEHTSAYPSNRVIEGPTVIKRDGKYYLLYSANDYQSIDYAVGYAVADSPYGPWIKPEGNPIISRHNMGENGTGHGDLFQDAEGKWRYIFHAHNSSTVVHPRRTYIVDIEFTKGENDEYETISAKPETLFKPQQTGQERKVYYIVPGGSGEQTGQNWENAFDLTTEALSSGKTSSDYWVKAGEYETNIQYTNRILYGGFDGTETELSQRDWAKNPTIIKGVDNASKPLVSMQLSAVLDGFIIQDNQNSTANGGGIHMKNRGVVRNCVVRNNSVAGDNVGGGIFVDGTIFSGTYPTIENCLIINNSGANNGGGIQVANNMALHIINSTIANNKITKATGEEGSGFGCGIGLPVNAKIIAENCIIYNNQKPNGTGTLTFSFGANYEMNNNESAIVRNCAYDAINAGNGTQNGVIFAEKTNCIDDLSITKTAGFALPTTFTGAVSNSSEEYKEFISADYSLMNGSVCIDAGDNNYSSVDKDLAGNDRIYNSKIDIGAYEYPLPQTIGIQKQHSSINFHKENDGLILSELNVGDNISIYTVMGETIFSSKATKEVVWIPLSIKGMYIIKLNNQSQKIIF